MPKPVDTLPEWASTANFPASVYPATYPWNDPHPNAGDPTPWSGQPTKDSSGLAALASQGHVPSEPTHAAHYNEWLNIASRWVAWVEDGNDAGAADAHIVETDADGTVVQLAGQFGGSSAAGATMVLGETASGDRALSVSEISGSDVAAAFAGTGNSAEVMRVSVSGGQPAAIFTSTYAGAAPGLGRAVEAYGSGNGAAVYGVADANAHGLHGIGGSTGGAGVYGEATAPNDPGVQGEGDSASAASHGVEGRSNHPDARGVWGLSDNLGSATGAGVYGQGQDDATGVYGLGDDGYGVVAETGTQRAAARFVPQAAEPLSADEGAHYHHDLEGPGTYAAAAWRRLWFTSGGLAQGEQTNQSGTVGTTMTTVATASLSDPTVPRKTGDVLIRVSFKFGYNSAGGASPPEQLGNYRIRDNTAGVNIVTKPITSLVLDNGVAGGAHQASATHIYAVPATGPRTFLLQLQTASGSLPNMNYSDASIDVLGVF